MTKLWLVLGLGAALAALSCSDSGGDGGGGGNGGTPADGSAGAGGKSGAGGSGGATGGAGGSAGVDAGLDAAADAIADVACQSDACSGWTLVWSDEFDGSGLLDESKWGYEKGFVRNNEAQYYTVARVDNARQENGHLVIEAKKEAYSGADYTSASVITKGKFDFTFGRLEVRAKIPTGKGSWPAIWLLGSNIDQVGWPSCGEIDVMENVGFNPNEIYCTVHYEGASGHESKGNSLSITGPTPFDDFHLYAMDWTSSAIVLSVDGKEVLTYDNDGNNPWPFDKPAYLLLNLAIGGSWGGQQGIDDSIFPLTYEIDYVRFYQPS